RLNLSTILSSKRGPLAVLSKAQRKAITHLEREIAKLEGDPARREHAMGYPMRMTVVAMLDDPATPGWKRQAARQLLNRVPLRYSNQDLQRLGLPVSEVD
ncbi:hypothetical protein, partial [Palleronia sp.]|uniref:hypothetical protein n=1 Tax=Palleronia sp. TaxID=1940284 RepID=UPI0035C86B04